MVHKDTNIKLPVISSTEELGDYISVFFERPVGFDYTSGDWIDIRHTTQELQGGKTYSLSSSPTEKDLRITLRRGLSQLKKVLESVNTGDEFSITQYGNDYGFSLKANKPSILIAGGVGVAPFRSMLKEMYDTRSKNEVRLIYINKSDQYLFGDELEAWQQALPNLKVTYVSTDNLSRKKREKVILSAIPNTDYQFYVSGPPGMVETNAALLNSIGVNVKNIKTDVFGGY